MLPFVEFRATIETRKTSKSIGEVIEAKRDEFKRLQPEIDHVEVRIDANDRGDKVGAGVEAELIGKIYFKKGAQPDLAAVRQSGQESFGYDFAVMPMFVLDTSNKTGTSAPILCRKCRKQIGAIPDYVRLATDGQIGQIRSLFKQAANDHIAKAHPDIDPSAIIF